MGYFYSDEYLSHHGILGQKWGVRRFQNRNGTRTAAGKQRQQENSERAHNGLTDQQKIALKIGAAVVGASLVAAGGVYLYKTGKIGNKGQEVVNSIIGDSGGSSKVDIGFGKSIDQIDFKLVKSINKDGWDNGNPPKLKPDYARNCSHTSVAYIMNSVLGMNVSAKGYGGVDELSGLVTGDYGRSKHVFEAVFDNLDTIELPKSEYRPDKAISHIKNESTGILRAQLGKQGHFVNYECDKNGNITIIDGQSGNVQRLNKALASKLLFDITDIIDCSNVTLREDAQKTLDYMVK